MGSDYHTPLPEGWIREFDPKTHRPFWVDTNVEPPRSIWVHPYEDERFLREHPDIRERLARDLRTSDQPPPYTPRRHSFSGPSSTSQSAVHFPVPERENVMRTSQSQPEIPKSSQQRRGFFGKLKDKAIGTKEEREARRREEEQRQRHLADVRRQRQQEEMAARRSYSRYPQYGGAPSGAGVYSQPLYAAPAGNSYGIGRRQGGFGGGGMGLPLLAGAAGGLLLGDILTNDFDGGGFDRGFGGGGFDGGGFDGGWGGGGF